jgi:ABC-2 type transport system permease protein
MTDEKADVLQRFLQWGRLAIPLIAVLLVVMQWWQNAQLMDEAQTANQAMKQLWVNHPPEFPIDTLAAGLYVPTAVSPLGAFDTGDGPWLAQSVWMQPNRLARGQDQLGYDVFPLGRQIGLTAAMFAQLFIPSLALVLGWRQVKQARSLTLQSWASLQTNLIEYAAPTVAISCLLTAALQRQSLGIEGALRLMLILGAYVIYSLACGSLCWLVYQKSSSLGRATGILVMFWLFNFSLARPITVNLASAVYPLPNLDSYAKKLDFEATNGYNGVESRMDRQRRFISEILSDYKVKEPSEVPVNISALILGKEERHQRSVGRRLRGELEVLFAKQEQFEQVMSIAFPFVAIQLASSSLSATDFASERLQLATADQFWESIAKKVYDDVAATSGPQALKLLRGSDYWSQFPFPKLEVPSPMLALSNCMMPAIGLALLIVAGLQAALRTSKAPVTEEEAV